MIKVKQKWHEDAANSSQKTDFPNICGSLGRCGNTEHKVLKEPFCQNKSSDTFGGNAAFDECKNLN